MNILKSYTKNDVSIYELSLRGVPVYIGSTSYLKKRISQHTRLGKIVFDDFRVIDKCNYYTRSDTEYLYIQLYKAWGFKLHNIADCKIYNAPHNKTKQIPLHLQRVEV